MSSPARNQPPGQQAAPWAERPRPEGTGPSAPPPPYSVEASGGLPVPPDVHLAMGQPDLAPPKYIKVERRHGRYPDLWATILFLLFTAIFIVFAVLGLHALSAAARAGPVDTGPIGPLPILTVLVVGIVVGLVLSLGYLALLHRYPRPMLVVSFWASIVLNLVMALFYLAMGIVGPGIILLLFAALVAYLYFRVRQRIELATLLLHAATTILRMYPALVGVTLGMAVFSGLFFLLWGLTAAGLVNAYAGSDSIYPIGLVHLFYLYWAMQVLQNVVHVTTCGVVATVYFEGVEEEQRPGASTTKLHVPIRHPTATSLGRALTTCLGPICFGSLVIALIQLVGLIYAMGQAAMNREGPGGNLFLMCLCCICMCILSVIEDLLEYFNLYAYVQVAIYNRSYIEAGKATWGLVKNRGLDAVINDMFIGTALGIGSLVVGVVGATAGYIYALVRSAATGDSGGGLAVAAPILCFLLAAALFAVVTRVLYSGTIATFVCLAEDPAVMAARQPALFRAIQQAYPAVNWGAVSSTPPPPGSTPGALSIFT